MVQSGDGCLLHPIQAVPAAVDVPIEKTVSPIGVGGDIVFCKIKEEYFCHIVQKVERPKHDEPGHKHHTKYYIGNIKGHINGFCHKKEILPDS